MNMNFAEIWQKYRKIITYLMCSVASALVESGIGWILLHTIPVDIVITNIMAIVAGAVVHYFLTTLFVFKVKNSGASVLVYAITFGLGVLLQSAVISFFYWILADMNEVIRYIFSKGLSLAIPFVVIYYVRSKLNERLRRKEIDADE